MQLVSLMTVPIAAAPPAAEPRCPAAPRGRGDVAEAGVPSGSEAGPTRRGDDAGRDRPPAADRGVRSDPVDGRQGERADPPGRQGAEKAESAPKRASRAANSPRKGGKEGPEGPSAAANQPADAFSQLLLRISGLHPAAKSAPSAEGVTGGVLGDRKASAGLEKAATGGQQGTAELAVGRASADGKALAGPIVSTSQAAAAAHSQVVETPRPGAVASKAARPEGASEGGRKGAAGTGKIPNAPLNGGRSTPTSAKSAEPTTQAAPRTEAQAAARPAPSETGPDAKSAAAAAPVKSSAASEGPSGAKRAGPMPKSARAEGPEAADRQAARLDRGEGFTIERTPQGTQVTPRSTPEGPTGPSPTASPPPSGVPRAAVAASRPASAEGPAGPRETPLSDQIAETVRASGAPDGRRIVVRLHPPELGRVQIVLRRDGDGVTGTIRVENEAALGRLAREATDLVDRLQDTGSQLRRLDVSLDPSFAGDGQSGSASRGGGQGADASYTDDGTGPETPDAAVPAEQPAETDGAAAPLVTDVAIDVQV